MPGLVRFSLSPALLLRLHAAYPSVVVGMKDSSGDWAQTSAYISALKHTGFKVYCGSETFLLQTMRAGGSGCISATANINGPAIARLAQGWQSVPAAQADADQLRLNALRSVIAKHNMIAVLAEHAVTLARAAMPPLVELSPDSKAACFKELDALQFTMEGLYAQP